MQAKERIKDKFPAVLRWDDVLNYCFSAIERHKDVLFYYTQLVKKDSEVTYNEKDNTLVYKPPYPIRTPEQLIEFFQANTDVQSIEVAKLKKGWPDCDAEIDKLEKEHKITVMRNKKDGSPRVIFADDPTLHINLDEEFVNHWQSIQLPSKDDIIRFLIASRRTPAGQVAANTAVVKQKKQARKNRQSTKQTNKHMHGIFKDYSGIRPKGK